LEKRNPIILIHGLWNTSSIFSSITPQLDNIGIEYFAPTLEHSYGMTSILDLTNKLNELILEKYGLEKKVDILYLCFPNNPTGATINKAELKKWVDYALQNKSLILFDAAYEAFIQDNDIPHSIYEIEGAKDCAIEFRSFSKNAGFTGVRCAYTVIPKNLVGFSSTNEEIELWPLWNRRQSTKFNGVSYIVQRGAEAVYSLEGQKEVKSLIDFYMENAKIMKNKLKTAGYKVYGGDNAPYIWIKVPAQMTSWDFFDFLLQKVRVVGTPGSGFGLSGEGYFRFSAFNSRSNVIDAMERIINI